MTNEIPLIGTAQAIMIRDLRQQVADLSTALERTADALHHEAHSVYTSWRICDDSVCRAANNLV